jgi:glutathione S-transferase
MSNGRYRLYYFPGRGRAEFIRYILHFTNTPYEEVPITMQEWVTKYKREMPMGVVPVLELPDGRQLSQSLAIGRYLATVNDLISKDPFENAWGDQLVGAIEDIYPVYYYQYVMALFNKDDEKKREAVQELKDEALKPLFDRLENMLGQKEHFCGNKLHWTDFAVAELIDRVGSIDKDFLKSYPKLTEHSIRIHQLPNLRGYIENRQPSMA